MEKTLLKQILLEQREEIQKIFQQKLLEREIASQFQKILTESIIKVIMGVRRCGKSVLVHQILKDKNYGYVNFDDERLISIKTEQLNDILEVLKEITPDFEFLFLDEIQNITGWELFANRLKRLNYNLTITGSNSKLLSQELATHLTGRHLTLELYPFSFKEFLRWQGIIPSQNDFFLTERKSEIKYWFDQYLLKSGFPEAIPSSDRENYLRNLYEKIITKDIISRFRIKYIQDFKEIALYLCSNFSTKISYNKIKNLFQINSVHTIKNYLGYLEESYLLFQLPAFSYKMKEQLTTPRKIYCIDKGIIDVLIPKNSSNQGRIIENLVFLELKRKHHEFYYYWDPLRQLEVDFLIKEGTKVTSLIQVCYELNSEETKKREEASLLSALRKFKLNEGMIITNDHEEKKVINNKIIHYLPIWKWMLS